MRAPNERFEIRVTPHPPLPCDVYVSSGTAPDGWYEAELLEWVFYTSVGWTGRARYRTRPSGGYLGWFAVEHIRKINPPN